MATLTSFPIPAGAAAHPRPVPAASPHGRVPPSPPPRTPFLPRSTHTLSIPCLQDGAAGEPAAKAAKTETPSIPVQLGPKTFRTGREAVSYFSKLVSDFPEGFDLNEYEHAVILDLLVKGHADAAAKQGSGVAGFRVLVNTKYEGRTKCFFVCRTDGSKDDFSYRKCLTRLFPGENLEHRSRVEAA